MSYFCPLRIKIAWIASALLLAPGCIEQSTVVKVRQDGSGLVHIRNYEQNAEITIGGRSQAVEGETKLPSPERIEAMIELMGGGAELVSASETTNRNGWDGYELVFKFDDVNQLVIRDKLTNPNDDDDTDATSAIDAAGSDDSDQPDETEPDETELGYRFEMNGGELMIRALHPEPPLEQPDPQEPPVGAVDPFAEAAASPPVAVSISSQMLNVYAKVLADMRVGVFVEIEGEIESTTAMHREGNLITLLRVEVGKLLDNPAAAQRLKAMSKIKTSPHRRQQMRAMSEEMEGFDFDAQDPIVVRLK